MPQKGNRGGIGNKSSKIIIEINRIINKMMNMEMNIMVMRMMSMVRNRITIEIQNNNQMQEGISINKKINNNKKEDKIEEEEEEIIKDREISK